MIIVHNEFDKKCFCDDYNLLKYRYTIDAHASLIEPDMPPLEGDDITRICFESGILCYSYWPPYNFWGFSPDTQAKSLILKDDNYSTNGGYSIDMHILEINTIFDLFLSLFHNYHSSEVSVNYYDLFKLNPKTSILELYRDVAGKNNFYSYKNTLLASYLRKNYELDPDLNNWLDILNGEKGDKDTIESLNTIKKSLSGVLTGKKSKIKNTDSGRKLFKLLEENNIINKNYTSCMFAPIMYEILLSAKPFRCIDSLFVQNSNATYKKIKEQIYQTIINRYNDISERKYNDFEEVVMHYLYDKYFHGRFCNTALSVIKRLQDKSVYSSIIATRIAQYSNICIGADYMLTYPLRFLDSKVIYKEGHDLTDNRTENLKRWQEKYEHHLMYNKFILYPLVYSTIKHRLYSAVKAKYKTSSFNATLDKMYDILERHLKRYAKLYYSFDWNTFYNKHVLTENREDTLNPLNMPMLPVLYNTAAHNTQTITQAIYKKSFQSSYNIIDDIVEDNLYIPLVELYKYWFNTENYETIFNTSPINLFTKLTDGFIKRQFLVGTRKNELSGMIRKNYVEQIYDITN